MDISAELCNIGAVWLLFRGVLYLEAAPLSLKSMTAIGDILEERVVGVLSSVVSPQAPNRHPQDHHDDD